MIKPFNPFEPIRTDPQSAGLAGEYTGSASETAEASETLTIVELQTRSFQQWIRHSTICDRP